MQIGIVAKRIGLSVDAIRFYERKGLLLRAPRTLGASEHTAKMISKHWLLCAARRGWDSNSARSGDC